MQDPRLRKNSLLSLVPIFGSYSLVNANQSLFIRIHKFPGL